MNALISTEMKTMSSREISELTGKKLSHIHRDIENMIDSIPADDPELGHVRYYYDDRGYATCVHLPKELSITLVSGYSVPLRRAIIKRWQELEDHQVIALPNFNDAVASARAWADAKESEQKAIAMADLAIRTKAEIGSRREATAMATASAKAREVERLKQELGEGKKWATITAVEKATKRKFGTAGFAPLKAYCKENCIEPRHVEDARYGQVRTWPAEAWMYCYAIDLKKIF